MYIEGKLKTRTWQDKEGNNRYSTEVITDNLTMLGSAGESMTISNDVKIVKMKVTHLLKRNFHHQMKMMIYHFKSNNTNWKFHLIINFIKNFNFYRLFKF